MVMELAKKYVLQPKTIKKSEMSFAERRAIDQLPAVAINGTVIGKGKDALLKNLEVAILQEMCRSEHIP